MAHRGKVFIQTIGCRLNQADSALIAERFRGEGYNIVSSAEADTSVCVLNSCTVTATAARKSRQAARRLQRECPEACVVVTGCGVEIENSAWKNENVVDLVLTNSAKKDIVRMVERFLEKGSTADRTVFALDCDDRVFDEETVSFFPFKSRSFLKIQEGCENFCSYCIVPYARGPERSRAFDDILEDFKNILRADCHEIVLTGVNICSYNDSGRTLNDLVSELASREGDFRIRLSSTEPDPDDTSIISTIKASEGRVCPYLHLPVQHGSNRILKMMNRKYTTEAYSALVKEARRQIPGIHIGSDIITGFPGETDDDFEKMLLFVRETRFANLHIFTYSRRAGTPAAHFPGRVPMGITRERYKVLSEEASKTAMEYRSSFRGKELTVLTEKKDREGIPEGWSGNYLRVKIQSSETNLNELVPARVTSVGRNGILNAEPVNRVT